jgi:transcriptional regulator with XRE-family HTH domain
VAEAVGITRAHLAKIETGGDAPGRATLSAFASYFGVSMDYLETGTEAPRSEFANDIPDSDDKRAWMLLGDELSRADKMAVAEFIRGTILGRPPRESRSKK